MPSIGVRELKVQASEIVRQVREQQAQYVITYRGEPVAVLLPIDQEAQQVAAIQQILAAQTQANVADLDDIRRRALEIAGRFDGGVSDLSTEHDQYVAEAFAA
jgi:prevent-host-death family protein